MSKSETQIINILNSISKDYNIPITELVKYSNNSNINSSKKRNCICKARKQDGFQCTRKSKPTSMFCGKHINNRKFGCISNEDYIECKSILYENQQYYFDEFNFAYEQIEGPIIKYKIIGMRNNGEIEFLK